MMKRLCITALALILMLTACTKAPSVQISTITPSALMPSETPVPETPSPTPKSIINDGGTTIFERFETPEGFVRTETAEGSFGEWLRSLPLKNAGTSAMLWDGTIKPSAIYDAVVDSGATIKEVMQNTDVLLYLRSKYLYDSGQYNAISFHFLSGFEFGFAKWSEGYRIKVDGSKVEWVKKGDSGTTLQIFELYLTNLYSYSNAKACDKDSQPSSEAAIGDVFLENGGAMIVDMAESSDGRTAVILARGGSPAQEPYIVQNGGSRDISPWFILPESGAVKTPEGDFNIVDLQTLN